MDTIITNLEFVVGGAGRSTASSSAAPSFPASITNTFNSVTSNPTFKTAVGTIGDAAAGCAAGATKGIFGGPHAALIGCGLGAGASLIGDLAKNLGPMVMSAAKGASAAHK
ncbi:MAG TPA: hypothetical protein VGG74_35125 [Kofleriaceae bacterium]|jgi:hypothetical protein